MSWNAEIVLLRVSCVLSIVGSLITMIVCAQIGVVQKRKGRDLIFWLSFADFGSSFIYLLSSFESSDDGSNSDLCQTYALLSIFFPVASFLWTDFIAYYLYDMVVNRQNVGEKAWSKMMFSFHIIAWGVSALCIILVGAFGHAGKDKNPDINNTGGWCWVHADSSRDLILWELVGGKFIEWISCLFILPYFYSTTILRLMQLDNGWDSLMVDNDSMRSSVASGGKTERLSLAASMLAPFLQCYRAALDCMASSCSEKAPALAEDLLDSSREEYFDGPFHLYEDNLSSHMSQEIMSAVDTPPLHGSSFVSGGSRASSCNTSHVTIINTTSVPREPSNDSESTTSSASLITERTVGGSIVSPTPDLTTATRSTDSSKVLQKPSFRHFYLKMAIVPIVFFFCRLWGSVRIVIYFSSPSHSAAAAASSGWLQTMQAIFDPSLGFFNALIFVFMSKQDRDAFFDIISHSMLCRCVRDSSACSAIFGQRDFRLKSPQTSSGKVSAKNKRVRYQGEDSELSASENDDHDGNRYSSSSFFDVNESSATCNMNCY